MTSQAKNTLLCSQLGADSNTSGDEGNPRLKTAAVMSLRSSLEIQCLDPIAEKVRRHRINITGLRQPNNISQANLRSNLPTQAKKRSIVSAKPGRRAPQTNFNGFAILASSGAQSSKNASNLTGKINIQPRLFGASRQTTFMRSNADKETK